MAKKTTNTAKIAMIGGAGLLMGAGFWYFTRKKPEKEPETEPVPSSPAPAASSGIANKLAKVKNNTNTQSYQGAKIRNENANDSTQAYKAAIGETLGITTGKTTAVPSLGTFIEFVKDGRKYNILAENAELFPVGTASDFNANTVTADLYAATSGIGADLNKVLTALRKIGTVAQYSQVSAIYSTYPGVSGSLLNDLLSNEFGSSPEADKQLIRNEFLRMGLKQQPNGTWTLSGTTRAHNPKIRLLDSTPVYDINLAYIGNYTPGSVVAVDLDNSGSGIYVYGSNGSGWIPYSAKYELYQG
jgi:hypothetical protein